MINQNNYSSEQNLNNIRDNFIQDEEDGIMEQSVTFGDPNFSFEVLSQHEHDEKPKESNKKPEPVKKQQETQSLAEAETKDLDVQDDDDHHEHDDWEENIFKGSGMPNHSAEHVKQDLALIKKHINKSGTG